MLKQINLFFEQYIALPLPDQSEEKEEDLHFACAALFIEMMYTDDKVHPQEQDVILNHIKDNFSLSDEQANSLITLATQERKQTTDYYQFTSLINKEFTQQQKIKLIKTLWQIAYADGELDMYEEHMVRKMADLLHVPHIEFLKAKHQVNDGQ